MEQRKRDDQVRQVSSMHRSISATAVQRETPNHASEPDLEKIAAEYDRAIRCYEFHYRQQAGGYGDRLWPDHYSRWHLYGLGYTGLTSPEGSPDDHLQMLAQWDQSLRSIEAALADFDASLPHIRDRGRDRGPDCVSEWKEYLQDLFEISKTLVHRIQERMRSAP